MPPTRHRARRCDGSAWSPAVAWSSLIPRSLDPPRAVCERRDRSTGSPSSSAGLWRFMLSRRDPCSGPLSVTPPRHCPAELEVRTRARQSVSADPCRCADPGAAGPVPHARPPGNAADVRRRTRGETEDFPRFRLVGASLPPACGGGGPGREPRTRADRRRRAHETRASSSQIAAIVRGVEILGGEAPKLGQGGEMLEQSAIRSCRSLRDSESGRTAPLTHQAR